MAFQKQPIRLMMLPLLTSIGIVGTGIMAGCDNKAPVSAASDTIESQSQHSSDTNQDNSADDHASQNDSSANHNQHDSQPSNAVATAPAENDTTNKAVGPQGYGGLSFGQTVTPALIKQLGLEGDAATDGSCYYVTNPKLTYIDSEGDERPSILYQVMNGKVASISVNNASIPFYNGLKVGDSSAQVMSAHPNALSYSVDKYADNGDLYQLLHNVNFDIIGQVKEGALLQPKDIKMHSGAGDIPLQIKYQLKDGQALSDYQIPAGSWSDKDKSSLTGTVYSIEIGTPDAIYLVEGCS